MAGGTDGGRMGIGSEWRQVLTSNGSSGWQRKSAWEANTARILESEEMRPSQAEAASAAAETLVAERVAAAAKVEGHLAEVGGQLAAVQAELVTARQLAERRGGRVRQVEAEAESAAIPVFDPNKFGGGEGTKAP
eukprot:CAMPEP_0198200684 /NCGR_PEP_ID=MMETSP1445-20131203/3653_1 /TAXON_ID=36898 /ORGANISM="Pyramimonas sp., Strain CCMP2087" /LENGTH=134 /DNA_ID=CAMNT_0043870817 /DNA_START=582 /DNA_END=983 /DNA_ORIENTATION=+